MPQSVAVRSKPALKSASSSEVTTGAAAVDREDFLRECRLLASLNHPNVVKLLGVSVSEEPFCSVLEHSLQGDLYHYLRQLGNEVSSEGPPRRNSSGSNGSGNNKNNDASYNRLLEMVGQIAAGMKYLEGRNIVHRSGTKGQTSGLNYRSAKNTSFGNCYIY